MNRLKTAAVLGPLIFLVVCLGATSTVVADDICRRITGPDEGYFYCGTEKQVPEVIKSATAGWSREIAVYAAENRVSTVEAYASVDEISPEVASDALAIFALANKVSEEEAENHVNDRVCIPADFNETNKLDHHPIIVIPGFWPVDLPDPPTCEDLRLRHYGSDGDEEKYGGLWTEGVDPVPDFWDERLTARIDWSSKDRLDRILQKNVFPVFKKLSEEETCKPNGCVLVTHSTGDLIASKWFDEGPKMLVAAGLENVDIVASLDFAGAAGGVELTGMTLDTLSVKHAATTLLGSFGLFTRFSETDLEKISFTWLLSTFLLETDQTIRREDTGIMQDLVINEARNNRFQDDNKVPRLRIASEPSREQAPAFYAMSKLIQLLTWANTFVAFANRPLDWWKIGRGSNDGTVSSHSSCGATSIGGFTRCDANLGFDGNREKNPWAAPPELKPNHYALLVSDKYHHLQIWNDEYLGESWLPWDEPARKLKSGSELNQSGLDAASEEISPAAKVYQIIQSAGSE